jgi:hypothetical protein
MAKQQLKYEKIINEFLKAREWEDELEVDLENKCVTLRTGVNSDGGSLTLIIEAFDEADIVDVFIYYGFNAKKAKIEQTTVLMNELHLRWRAGRFMVLPDGRVRWTQRVDFEGSTPTGKSIEQMVSAGFGAVERFNDVISSVAVSKQTAAEAIAEYDSAQEEAEKADEEEADEGPNEL